MKAGLITMSLLVLAMALSGCGQKGPLYQPAEVQERAETDAAPDSDR